ncbi:MAG TPA: DinB family protein [Chloroflexota bacterium]|nr:DinB family protein [Chloroflexota bacterium]
MTDNPAHDEEPFREPPPTLSDPRELLLGFLDCYREVIARKLSGLPEGELRRSRLPSGWTPLGLVKHLVYMERRWVQWGFRGEAVEDPWGDQRPVGTWHVEPDETAQELIAALQAEGTRTRAIVEPASLENRAASGGRFNPADEHPTLGWILFHVLQEYVRHAGHLDIARELADGSTGE